MILMAERGRIYGPGENGSSGRRGVDSGNSGFRFIRVCHSAARGLFISLVLFTLRSLNFFEGYSLIIFVLRA